jgi:hypothetical protein
MLCFDQTSYFNLALSELEFPVEIHFVHVSLLNAISQSSHNSCDDMKDVVTVTLGELSRSRQGHTNKNEICHAYHFATLNLFQIGLCINANLDSSTRTISNGGAFHHCL